MWPFSLLKKLSQDPEVGQTRGDYIGCYLLGTHTSGRDDDISYISLATTREQLEQDARQYLQEFLEQHPQLTEAERHALQDLLEHWNARADAHLAQDGGKPGQPLAVQGGKAEPLGGEELGARLAAFAAQNPDVPVFVAAPGTMEYEKVMDTMALIQNAQVRKISLLGQSKGQAK